MKKIIWVWLSFAVIVLGFGIYKFNFTNQDIYLENGNQINTYDATYLINGEKVTLQNGISEIPVAPQSASKIITKYFGNDLKHDLNEDGIEDKVFILTQETGGSGVFYYVVALLNTVNGPMGSSGVLLGDRIAPQTINIDEGKTAMGTNRQNVIVVNYADRKLGESFSVAPSIAKSIWLKLDPKTMQFGEVAQNFEGEAGVVKMALNMKTWNWVNAVYGDGKELKPALDKKFTLSFKDNKTFSATTDCNNMGGQYIVKDNQITFSNMFATEMYCESSQQSDFTKLLEQTQSYFFNSKGELIFNLKFDSGSVVFK